MSAGTQYNALYDDPGEVLAAKRPYSLCEPLCAARPVRHGGRRDDVMPKVQVLNYLVPQSGEGELAFFPELVVEPVVAQVIVVPKTCFECVPLLRSALRVSGGARDLRWVCVDRMGGVWPALDGRRISP